MQWLDMNVGELKRENNFSFRVCGLYYCRLFVLPESPILFRDNTFEVNIRLKSDADFCEDTINGEKIKLPFPNVAWKLPETKYVIRCPAPRDTIAFLYPASMMKQFEMIGMFPQVNCQAFAMTPALERLIAEFRKIVCNLYTPGGPDQIDWVCFKLIRELLFSSIQEDEMINIENRIRNISMWFQTHYNEEINMDDVAAANGMSHARFFREWKHFFNLSPTQYVIELKLQAAALRLLQTGLPISCIVKEVNFSGLYAFYQRFFRKYGMTPDEYRKTFKGSLPNFL